MPFPPELVQTPSNLVIAAVSAAAYVMIHPFLLGFLVSHTDRLRSDPVTRAFAVFERVVFGSWAEVSALQWGFFNPVAAAIAVVPISFLLAHAEHEWAVGTEWRFWLGVLGVYAIVRVLNEVFGLPGGHTSPLMRQLVKWGKLWRAG